jgi:hypothetical protein
MRLLPQVIEAIRTAVREVFGATAPVRQAGGAEPARAGRPGAAEGVDLGLSAVLDALQALVIGWRGNLPEPLDDDPETEKR